LISFVSVVGMSSLFFIGADRADPMPSKNERQGWSANIFFFTKGHRRRTNLGPSGHFSIYQRLAFFGSCET
jgi:hypothetical protein